ncbi:MAG: M48 family metallopeptidase [Bacteroidales bacterium]|nr:M48 family metallopeptidase [Bacteroidales bacterium]
MYRVEARYFDGQSSRPQAIVVFTDERFDELRLQCADGDSFFWNVDDLIFEQYEDCLELRNKQFSGALLQIKDEHFSKSFLEAMKFKNKFDVHRRILNIGFPKIVGLAVGMLALIVAAYFWLLPPIAERFVAVVPQSADIALGNMFMNTFLNENRIDSTRTAYLEQFAAQIDFKNTIPLHFTVVESGQINAFALPNGQIVVYTGLLDRLQHSSELAALLAHEAAHVNYRHSMKMLFRNLAGYLLISLLLTDVSGIMAVLADNAHRLHNLSYSRKFEREADEQGLKILMNNHIDPNGMVQLFVLLENISRVTIPQIISTHPLTAERKENMQKIIKKSEYSLFQNDYLDSLFVRMQQAAN